MHKFWINLLVVCLLVNTTAQAQTDKKYWITFNKKAEIVDQDYVSSTTLQHRSQQLLPLVQESDLPVTPQYIDSLTALGITIFYQSKWLNAVSIALGNVALSTVESLDFVKEISPVNTNIKVLSTHYETQPALTAVLDQINAKAIETSGFNGSGISIGIIDVGYFGAKINGSLKSTFKEGRVLGFRDFVDHTNENPFGNLQPFSHAHGTTVWKLVGGLNSSTDIQYGLATKANYYLARTDNTRSEFRTEEDYWIAAIEWMDSLGIKLVNTSLGYSLGFDDPKENYKPEDMDGSTTKISKAAQIAVDEKGMLIVVAAGNEGNDVNWQIVSAPADAKGVLSVGATKIRTSTKARYSSIGPGFLPYLKPNVSCYSASGTSFSAPVITGLAACIMQMDSTLNNYEIISIIEKSSNLYPFGNNYIGYGIPDANKILQLVRDKDSDPNNNISMKVEHSSMSIKIDSRTEGRIILFHKSNDRLVLKQEEVIHQGNELVVTKPEGAKFTTVVLKEKVIELEWQ